MTSKVPPRAPVNRGWCQTCRGYGHVDENGRPCSASYFRGHQCSTCHGRGYYTSTEERDADAQRRA